MPERAIRGRLRMFLFDSKVSEGQCSLPSAYVRSPATCAGVPGAPRYHQTPCFDVKELGEIDMVFMALATLDLVAGQAGRRLPSAFRELLG